MSTTLDVDDNDETLFQFDPFDSHHSLLFSSSPQPSFAFRMSPRRDSPAHFPPTASLLPSDMENSDGPPGSEGTPSAKGKATSKTMPMPIRQSAIVRDLFELSSPTSYDSSSSAMISSPSTSHFSSDSNGLLHRRSFLREHMEQLNPTVSESFTGKGKEKAPFPMLPPLSFSNIDFDCHHAISLTPGPSSCGTSPTINDHSFPPSSVTDVPISSPSVIPSSNTPTNLANQAFPPSIGPPSNRVASATPSNLSRQLLEVSEKNDDSDHSGSLAIDPTSLISSLNLQLISGELSNHYPAWYISTNTLNANNSSSRSPAFLKQKTRSRSSPYPISALDIIPDTSTDIFQPLPVIILNYFDLVLPKELRLHILRAIVDLHEDDLQRSILEGRFTVAKATSSRSRWIGRDKGVRELFKLSRVCL